MSKEIVYTCNGCPLAPCSTDPSLGRFKTEKEIGACGAVIAVQNEALKKTGKKTS